jgi:hypothetical protein
VNMRHALAMVSPLTLLACATTDSSTLATTQIQPRFTTKVEASPNRPTTFVSAILGQPGTMSNVRLAPGDVLTAKTDKDPQLGFAYNEILQVYSFTLENIVDRTQVTISLTRANGTSAPLSTIQIPAALALKAPTAGRRVEYKGGAGSVEVSWSNPTNAGNVHFFAYPCGGVAGTTTDLQGPDSGTFTLQARSLAVAAPTKEECVTVSMQRRATGTVDPAFAAGSKFEGYRNDFVNVTLVP